MSKSGRQLKKLYEHIEPTDELNEKVILRVEGLRARGARTWPCLTRRSALVGAAGLAVIAGLAVSAVAWPSPSANKNSFGLAIAQADELNGPVKVSAGSDGLMPCENDTRPHFNLKLNLSARGFNIVTVTYHIEGSPPLKDAGLNGRQSTVVRHAVSLAFGDEAATTDASGGTGAVTTPHLSVVECESLTINYRERAGQSDYQPDEGALNYVSVTSADEIWSTDPILMLMRQWLDLAVRPTDEVAEERESARRAFVEAYASLAVDSATFYDWLCNIYVTGFELASALLAKTSLVAEVTFGDGSSTTCSYRIRLVDEYKKVLGERFDALCELDGYTGIERARSEYIPWVSLPIPTDEQITADARLSEPIFTIEDVTDC